MDKISISRAGRQIELLNRNLKPQTKWSRKTKLACSHSYANFYEINNALKECRIGSILLNFGIEIKLIVLDFELKYFGRNKF